MKYTDAETGFVYLRARYYDPATGQFISRDPLMALTGSAYGYVGGNPLNGTDPLGLTCLLGHVHGSSGRCRGTNVATDLKVAGVALSVIALPVAGAAIAVEGLTILGLEASTVGLALGAASTGSTFVGALLDCRNGFSRDCAISLAEAGVSGLATGFGAAGVTVANPVLRMIAGLLGLASSTASLMDTCRPGKTIFEA